LPEISKKYYSKVLLIGEYTVTSGYSALAIPYKGYSGQWLIDPDKSSNNKSGLQHLLDYIETEKLLQSVFDLYRFQDDLDKGLIFDSDIPTGYGLGSSGALVAGFYDRYAVNKTNNINDLKSILALTESAFHGSSSGIDPIVSYLNSAVKIDEGKSISQVELDISTLDFYLFDTGLERKTAPFVHIFKEKMKNKDFIDIVQKLGESNQKAIDCILNKEYKALAKDLQVISKIELEHFKEMIPVDVVKIWETGLDSDQYYMKLCGAGGGGMMLCYFPKTKDHKELSKKLQLKPITHMSN
jgi:mevalonate kinase